VRVLVVEDGDHASEQLTSGLRRHGHEVDRVGTGQAALHAHHRADLVLLDLDLPDLDGLEVCREIRCTSDTPIITVTARSAELDRVLGLQAGSDDYVVKPYGFRELMARIEAVMRRARPGAAGRPAAISHGPLRIDLAAREVCVHGRPVALTRKEFDFLRLLATQPQTVVCRREIMAQVWDYESVHSSRTIDTHVSSLRQKLGSPDWIVTVRGVGFRLGAV
jgi:DNA-binding response OmpR family regulator